MGRRKLKQELYKLLKEPRTSISAARIKVVCAELDKIPPQIQTNKNQSNGTESKEKKV
jgi:hypothetical protein